METEAEKIGPRVGRFSAGAERSRTLSTACEPGGGRARPQISVGGRRGSWSVFIVKFRIRSGVGVELERRPQCNAIISQFAGETFSLGERSTFVKSVLNTYSGEPVRPR